MNVEYYTYIYFDEKFIPYYVGEGTRARWVNVGHRVPVPPPERILRFYHNTKTEAFDHEIFLITHIGRRDLVNSCGHYGPLMNLTDGGPGLNNPNEMARQSLRRHGIVRAEQNNLGSNWRENLPKLLASTTFDTRSAGGRKGGPIGGRSRSEKKIAALKINCRLNRGVPKAGTGSHGPSGRNGLKRRPYKPWSAEARANVLRANTLRERDAQGKFV